MKRDPLAAKGNERGIEVEGIERLGPLHLWKRIPLRGTGHRRLRSRGVQRTRRRRATVKVTGDSSVTARNGPVVTSLRLTVMRSSVQRVAVLPPLCTTIHYSYSTVNPSRRSYITLVQRRSRFRRHGSRFRIVSLIKTNTLAKTKDTPIHKPDTRRRKQITLLETTDGSGIKNAEGDGRRATEGL